MTQMILAIDTPAPGSLVRLQMTLQQSFDGIYHSVSDHTIVVTDVRNAGEEKVLSEKATFPLCDVQQLEVLQAPCHTRP